MPNLRLAFAAAAAVAALAVAPAAASANATVTYLGAGTVIVDSNVNEVNRIALALEGTVLRITESGPPAALDIAPLSRCTKAAPKVVTCDTSAFGLTGITVTLGDGDDGLGTPAVPPAVPTAITGSGEGGNDTLVGGGGADQLEGGPGDDAVHGMGGGDPALAGAAGTDSVFGGGGDDQLSGGDGPDALTGGDGNDTLSGNEGDDALDGVGGNDRLDGAEGADTATYAAAATNVKVVLPAGEAESAGNGPEGENDTLVAVENATGGPGADQLTGSDGGNGLDGRAGADAIDGAGGDDALRGGEANDKLTGGPGADALDGVNGADALDGGEGADSYVGGPGNDVVTSRDGVAEPNIDCQDGTDEIVADNGADGAAGCEAVAPQTVSGASLSGDPVEGATLTLNRPVVSGGPFTVPPGRREWHRCTTDGKCALVPLNADTYKLAQVDVGKVIFARVVVGNAAGTVTEETARTPPIGDVPGAPRPGGPTPPPDVVTPRGPAAEVASFAKARLARSGKTLRLTTGRRIACRAARRQCAADVVATVKLKPKKKKGKKRRKAKTTEIGAERYLIKAGQAADAELKLERSVVKRLKPGRKVTISLKISVRQFGSDDVVQKVKLKLKVPRRR